MSELKEQQLQFLDELNKIRLTITKEFKQNPNPSISIMFNQLLKLEVLLAENKEKEDLSKYIDENHCNIDALMMNTFVKPKIE